MNTKERATLEFKACGWIKEDGTWCDEWQQLLCEQVLELLEVFGEHGHSGSTAPYAVNIFKKLAMYEPLKPLTGEAWEWGEPFDKEGTRQNKRCSHVFLRPDGTAYDINGKVFREPNGCCYTSRDSRVDVIFPYTPKTEYVNVASENPRE